MVARLKSLILVPLALALVSCANYPNGSGESLLFPNNGGIFNPLRGKIYFGPETTLANPSSIEPARLLVIDPQAVPFLAYEPIVLSTNQDGTVGIRTDTAAGTMGRGPVQPDLSTVSELLGDFAQCPLDAAPAKVLARRFLR